MKKLLPFVLLYLIVTACVPAETTEPIIVNPTRNTKETTTPFPTHTLDETSLAATATGAATLQTTPGFIPTPTPMPSFPGIIYSNSTGTWQIGADWQPVQLSAYSIISLSPDEIQMVYQDNGDIWLVNRQTGETTNLTTDQIPFSHPQWWPANPTTLILSSWPPNDTEPGREGLLTALNLDGSYQVLATGRQFSPPSPSPTSLQIAYNPNGQAALYDWESGETTFLLPADFGLLSNLSLGYPAWSPDGKQLAWTAVNPENGHSGAAVVILDIETHTGRLFDTATQTGGVFHPFDTPTWSPDGRFLAYLSTNPDPQLDGVWVINPQDGHMTFVGEIAKPVWSPDGRFLALSTLTFPNVGNTYILESDSWYSVQMYVPGGGIVVDWR